MRPRLLSLTLVFAGLILLSRSVYVVSLCATPDFFQAADGAEVIFSGKIKNVETVQTGTSAAGVVTLKVETWWTGGNLVV